MYLYLCICSYTNSSFSVTKVDVSWFEDHSEMTELQHSVCRPNAVENVYV